MQGAEIRELREKRQLHPEAEARIKYLLGKIPTQNYGLAEGWGVTSGRTDVSVYLRQRRVVHFEIFGSESTVFRDVNNLHMSRASQGETGMGKRITVTQPSVRAEPDCEACDSKYGVWWLYFRGVSNDGQGTSDP
jgi:hypothetical protein